MNKQFANENRLWSASFSQMQQLEIKRLTNRVAAMIWLELEKLDFPSEWRQIQSSSDLIRGECDE